MRFLSMSRRMSMLGDVRGTAFISKCERSECQERILQKIPSLHVITSIVNATRFSHELKIIRPARTAMTHSRFPV
jgi:hypothetical protein